MTRTITRTATYRAPLDNHSITRNFAGGHLHFYAAEGDMAETITLHQSGQFKDAEQANYLIDDGATVRPFYVSGWSREGLIYLQPFPVNGAIRPDNGRPADFSTWALGPRRTYHLKVTYIKVD